MSRNIVGQISSSEFQADTPKVSNGLVNVKQK